MSETKKPGRSDWSTKGITAIVSECTEAEAAAKMRKGSNEWRAILEKATTKHLVIKFETYREARVVAQRITAVRSFYGFDVTISHRGMELLLCPRMKSDVQIIEHSPTIPTETK